MRVLIWLVLAAALAWSVWWFVGSSALRRGIEAAIEDLRLRGWRIETAEIVTRGFPNRFDTTVTAPVITPPDSEFTWRAPFFQVLALSYRPTSVIAVLPDSQSLSGPFGEAEIASSRARGSVTLAPSAALTLDRSSFVIEDLRVTVAGATFAADTALFATRQPADTAGGAVQNVGLALENLRMEGATVPFATARLDATLDFDAPIDRHALQDTAPRLTGARIDALDVDWGEAALAASGEVDIGADGIPTGEIPVELRNWPGALEAVATLGMLPAPQAAAIGRALGFLTGLSAAPDTLAAPLVLRGGQVFLGPLALGAAPRFRGDRIPGPR